jgi:ribosomal protein S18 acetylase RimI-like enzyme
MHVEIINTTFHKCLPFVQHLYETTFALHERRDWQQMLALLSEPAMHLGLIAGQAMLEQSVGFVMWWELNGWLYVEHMAIEPALRSKGYGKQVITYLTQLSANMLVLEVDLPDSDYAKRRIGFYERLGLVVCPITYVQPPYRKGEAPTPMLLMSMPAIKEVAEFNFITGLIRDQVYERYY